MQFTKNKISIKDNILIENIKLDDRFFKTNGLKVISGKNAVGKTTLLNELFFHIVGKKKVIYITQQLDQLMQNMSVIDNILLGLSHEDKLRDTLKLNNHLGLLDLKTKNLSGGQKRLIYLYRCIMGEYDIIMLDEPSNDLDKENELFCINAIVELSKNATVIVSSHNQKLIKESDILLEISNKQLNTLKDQTNLQARKAKQTHVRIITSQFVKKFYKPSKTKQLLFIFFAIVCLIFSVSNPSQNDQLPEYIEENQLDLFTISSLIGEKSMKNALPSSTLSCISESFFKIRSCVNKSMIDLDKDSNLEQIFVSKSDIKVNSYVIEYQKEGQFFYPTDLEVQDYTGDSSQVTYLKKLFKQEQEVLNFHLNNRQGGYLVKSNITIGFTLFLDLFNSKIKVFKILLLILLLLAIFVIIDTLIRIKKIKRQMQILGNASVKLEIDKLTKSRITSYFYYLCIILTLILLSNLTFVEPDITLNGTVLIFMKYYVVINLVCGIFFFEVIKIIENRFYKKFLRNTKCY